MLAHGRIGADYVVGLDEGMHKHFRMIAVSEFMKSQGYASSHTEHTRIPGIWKKLGTLYNLPGLDERVSNRRVAASEVLVVVMCR